MLMVNFKSRFSDDHIIEIHGSIHHLQHFSSVNGVWSADELEVTIDNNLHFVGENTK